MPGIGSLSVFLTADTGRFEKGMNRGLKKIGIFRRDIDKMARGAAIAFGVIAAASAKAVASLIEQENAEAKLEAALMATGHAAGFSADELKKQAAELQKVTTSGDEAIITVQALLATFTEIKGDQFTRATEAVLDLAVAMDMDARSAAIQLGKALNDPIAGVTALNRAGVVFNETQKEMIKGLAEQGRVVEAQTAILDIMAEQGIRGNARAMAETTGGEMKQFINAWGDLEEAIGGVIVAGLGFQGQVDGAKTGLEEFTDFVNENAMEWGNTIAGFFDEAEILWRTFSSLLSNEFGFLAEELRLIFGGDILGFIDPEKRADRFMAALNQFEQEAKGIREEVDARTADRIAGVRPEGLEEKAPKGPVADLAFGKTMVDFEIDVAAENFFKELDAFAETFNDLEVTFAELDAEEMTAERARLKAEEKLTEDIDNALIGFFDEIDNPPEQVVQSLRASAIDRGSVEAFRLEQGTQETERGIRKRNADANEDAAEAMEDIKDNGVKIRDLKQATF